MPRPTRSEPQRSFCTALTLSVPGRPIFEALRERSQDVMGPRQQVGAHPQQRRSDGPPFLLGPMWRSEIDCAGRVNVNRQPTAICIDFTARSIEGEQYARLGLALLLHVQQT